MSELDFWTKYCRAEYLHSTKNAVAAAAEAAEDEELAVFLKHDDILASEARRKVISVPVFPSTYVLVLLFFPFKQYVIYRVLQIQHMQIRRVDPTLDIEADEGDDYTHLPVPIWITLTNMGLF